MAELLLAEALFLLSHDEESGRDRAHTYLEYGLAGALLLDLAIGGRLTTDGRKLVAAGDVPNDPLLAEVWSTVAADERGHRPVHWVTGLPRALKPIRRRVGESLVRRGILGEERDAMLGIFTRTRWPERDPEPERRLRAELAAVLVDGADPGLRLGPLIGLLEALGLTRRLVAADLGREQRGQVRARAREIARGQKDGSGIPAAVNASVRDVQAAIMAATVSAAVVAASNN